MQTNFILGKKKEYLRILEPINFGESSNKILIDSNEGDAQASRNFMWSNSAGFMLD